MSIKQTVIPITPVRTLEESFAVETAIRSVERFLSAYFPSDFLTEQKSGAAIVGQWLSMMPGREQDHAQDIETFVQDLVTQIQIGKERSLVSDALSFFLGGLMPTYTRAKVLAGMLADRRPAAEVEAYFHHTGYGSVKQFIEENGSAIKNRATEKCKALIDVLRTEVRHLDTEWQRANTIVLAQAQPSYQPTQIDAPGGGAANDPKMPRPKPNLRLVPPAEPVPPSGATRLLPRLAVLVTLLPEIIVGVVLFGIPSNIGQGNPEEEFIKKQQELRAKQKTVPIPHRETNMEAATNRNNNECQAQIEQNQKNGAQCEDDGYVMMETALQYQRLVNPPKGRGLDGLFEKQLPYDMPNPLPEFVKQPKPGKLIFIPENAKPPKAGYDFTGKPQQSMYPRFVVWEAKHISKGFDPSDTDGMTKEAKNRLGNTCDGAQMSEPWTEKRIPQALRREKTQSKKAGAKKTQEIRDTEYARWMFLCLPGPIGNDKIVKLYVLIDVVAAGMELENVPIKPRKKPLSPNNNSL
jgi:hypothetical protein